MPRTRDPGAFLEPVPHALRDAVSRYARTHGPFTSEEVARRYAVAPAAIEPVLEDLVQAFR